MRHLHSIPQKRKIDIILLITAILLVLLGLLAVFDASQFQAFQEFGDKMYFIRQQLISAALGFILLVFFIFFDYHRLEKIALPFLLVSILLLILVFVPGFGVLAGGAHRWLKFAGFTIQPAEIIKLSTIIYFASVFQNKVQTKTFVVILGIVAVIVGVFQKDLGSAIVYSLVAFSVYFIAGAPTSHFLGLLFTGIFGAVFFIATAPYRIQRVLAFLDPFADTQGFTYHISQVLIAIGSGGIFGLGIGQSRQKFSYIPEVTTDSIFSIIGEEFGFIGCLLLLTVICFLIYRSFKIAENAPDKFGRLLAIGLVVWLGSQAIVNLAAMVSLLPLTGVPLPFISYGGSALIANLVTVGILLNISRQGHISR
ncbi:MAG: putative lipid II flippase FtsW [Candidatus Daviesbacteria bacterium]|nr:putative lipid II flippase FtsW [Candidatus Daviesbacteria bacterium]